MRIQKIVLFCCTIFTVLLSLAHAGPKRVAIIGGGGAGLTAAWLLDEVAEVTLFEKNDSLGGHADTLHFKLDGVNVTVEAGFEFFNSRLYPNFLRLLKALKVPVAAYKLNYSFHSTRDGVAFLFPPQLGTGLLRKNYVSTLLQFKKFLDDGEDYVAQKETSETLKHYLENRSYPRWFLNDFLLPFLASMWGVPVGEMHDFIAYPVVKWLTANASGLGAPEFLEVPNGLSSYIDALASGLSHTQVRLNSSVTRIEPTYSGYLVSTRDGEQAAFDEVILATNAKVAARLLARVPAAQNVRQALSRVEYFRTDIAIHGDDRCMPRNPDDWGIVNVQFNGASSAITVHKPWKHPTRDIFKTWVTREVALGTELPSPMYALRTYEHPKLTSSYQTMQRVLAQNQGRNQLWFAGMYTQGLDSHESAVSSAIEIARKIGPESKRLLLINND